MSDPSLQVEIAAAESWCFDHADRAAVTKIYSARADYRRIGLCKECSEKLHPFGRAYATGTGKEAHAEAQEAKRLHDEGTNERTRISKFSNARGGHR